jgi:succinate-semialdehyde dehydrogenase / glutarate-semialdehyde dehydrogenase
MTHPGAAGVNALYRGQLFIGGEWRDAVDGDVIDIVDPGRLDLVGSVPRATESDISAALEAATQSFGAWAAVDAWTRSAVLRRTAGLIRDRAERIAEVMTREQGKPIAESVGEVRASADYFDWFADESRRHYGRLVDGKFKDNRILVLRQPIGVVAAFTAWNFPALLPARKIAAALAAGCSMVLKPAEESPLSALEIARACGDAGLPPGVLNVIVGDPAQISSRLIESGAVRKVSLTGSIAVGRSILELCARHMIPAAMELGGHAPVLVLDDADLDRAVELCVAAKFRNAGQVCISPSRFYVAQSIVDEFARRFAEAARALRIGWGMNPEVQVGPLSNERRLDAVERIVHDALTKGAQLRTGGRRPDDLPGYFYEPTVLAEVTTEMEVMQTEPFGPLAPIMSIDDDEDGITRANALEYGLAAYVFTRDVARAFEVSERLETGMVGVNNLIIATPEAPFGGVKQSGFGREGGSEGIDEYSVPKYVNIALR